MNERKHRQILRLIQRAGIAIDCYQDAKRVLTKHADLAMAEYALRKRLGMTVPGYTIKESVTFKPNPSTPVFTISGRLNG